MYLKRVEAGRKWVKVDVKKVMVVKGPVVDVFFSYLNYLDTCYQGCKTLT